MIKSLKEDSFIHGTSNESNLLGVIDPNVQRKNEYRKIFEDNEFQSGVLFNSAKA